MDTTIKKLPKIVSLLLPEEYELLPNTSELFELEFDDMDRVLSEMSRVLKNGKYAVIIIGSNDIQTGGIRLETKVEELALNHSFVLDQKIIKTIKGIQNTMKDKYILFLSRVK